MKNTFYRITFLAALFAFPLGLMAQEAAAPVNPYFWENTFGSLTMVGGVIVIVGALLAIVRLLSFVVRMEELRILKEKGVEEIVETYKQPQASWWSRFMKSATLAVPVSQEKDIDLGHDYDGIRELDNKLPPWWLWMFYISIIFSIIYWILFHVTASAPNIHQEYEQDMETAKASVAAYMAKQADQVDENTVVLLTDAQDVELGKSIFTTSCVPCHGASGEGNSIGPNLTDEYWLHGGGIKNVFNTIKYGVIEKGMQSWKDNLRPTDMQRVASYILSLQGTNPPGAKDPQGDLWKPDGEAQPANTEATQGDTGHVSPEEKAGNLAEK
jgi:cytochrome c oxidase cbb3-type subunit III